jgi:hypothetical protein
LLQEKLLRAHLQKQFNTIGVCGGWYTGHHTRTDVIMIDALVRKFLGTTGSGLLDFYLQYSLWINALLFTYAVLVIFARRNYAQIIQHILADFFEKYGNTLAKKSPREIRALLLKWNIPWKNGMRAGWFPFISSPQGFLLRLKSDRTFQKIFTVEVLVDTIVRQIAPKE